MPIDIHDVKMEGRARHIRGNLGIPLSVAQACMPVRATLKKHKSLHTKSL